MFWHSKPTIDDDDLDWQIECWRWLLDNLGGIDTLVEFRTLIPSSTDFPKSNFSKRKHVEFVFQQVAEYLKVDAGSFTLVEQDQDIDPALGPLALVQDAPTTPLGTYSVNASQSHLITYSPAVLNDLEALIATFAHEICHPILLNIPVPPPGEPEAEEFATDLTMAFFGFGVFGGNGSFQFDQFTDSGTGTQGWSAKRSGYLSQNEWGFAMAVRAHLSDESFRELKNYCSPGLYANIAKNFKFLERNDAYLETLR